MNKRIRRIFLLLALFLLAGAGARAQAGGFNLIKTVTEQPAPAGRWVKAGSGYRFRYTVSKKYAKNTWIRTGTKISFADRTGFRATGFKKYRQKTYYLDARGYLALGWQRVGGEKYYFSRKTGAMLTGWKEIGKNKYYFSEKGILQKNTWVGSRYVDAGGRCRDAKRIFVGDSRTAGMRDAVNNRDTYIAQWGKGYEWFADAGVRKLQRVLDKNPYSAVIFNLGVNDLKNAELYVGIYERLIRQYPKVRFYFMSVNPVEEGFLHESGFSQRENAVIEGFNQRMEQVFGGRYIDSYHWLLEKGYLREQPGGYGTIDGLHYTDTLYRKLHGYAAAQAR